MLVTEVNLVIEAGDGGNGKVSFFKIGRGPDGGNGGRGGSVWVSATTDIYALQDYTRHHLIKADNGQHGMAATKNGRAGKDMEIKLPVGTVITDTKTGEEFEVNSPGSRFLLCRGGLGGLGNREFRSGANTTPMTATEGEKGQSRSVNLNLKLIADFGLIGFPNSGKSSLLSKLTAAKPKIGNYPFTTLEPNLGAANGKIIADIPGLIEGASSGKGLGTKFLKHIERVKLLFHCLSCESVDPYKDYQTVRQELGAYNSALLAKPEIVLLTKTDLRSKETIKKITKILQLTGQQVLPVSIYDPASIEKIKSLIK